MELKILFELCIVNEIEPPRTVTKKTIRSEFFRLSFRDLVANETGNTMNVNAPLLFQVPNHLQHTVLESMDLPAEQNLIMEFAIPYLTTFGYQKENYILQQIYNVLDATIVLLTVNVKSYTKLIVRSTSGFTAFQYTLAGFAFALLNGHGCVPLFEKTHTLQFISNGDHQVIYAPGVYHYFYIVPGNMIESLIRDEPGMRMLSDRVRSQASEGKLAARLPTLTPEKQVLSNIINLPARTKNIEFILTSQLMDLMKVYKEQLINNSNLVDQAESVAFINSYIANNIQLPISEIIKGLKNTLFIETATLRNLWVKRTKNSAGAGNAPRKQLKMLRLEKGLYHLTVEHLGVGDTAEILGFQNVSSFSTQFHNHFKVPPQLANSIFYP